MKMQELTSDQMQLSDGESMKTEGSSHSQDHSPVRKAFSHFNKNS